MTVVKYSYKTWDPPKLTLEQELELGRHIAIVGRDNFVEEFNKNLYRHNAAADVPQAKTDPVRMFFVILIFVALIFLGAVYAPNAIKAKVFVLFLFFILIWFGSIAWAAHKFNRWVNRIVAQYAEHQARSTNDG